MCMRMLTCMTTRAGGCIRGPENEEHAQISEGQRGEKKSKGRWRDSIFYAGMDVRV